MTNEMTTDKIILKLYIITREDLPIQYQMGQIAHATVDFVLNNIEPTLDWRQNSDIIITKLAPTEQDLLTLETKLKTKGLNVISFKETDIGNETTSIALIAPHSKVRKLIYNLKLAGTFETDNAKEELAKKFALFKKKDQPIE